MPVEFFYRDRAALLRSLQDALVAQLESSLARADLTTLFLSGGTSPVPLYRNLSGLALSWHKLHVALVDERWVPTESDGSNERLLRETLLQGEAASCHFAGMKNAFSLTTPEEAARAVSECNDRYANLPRPWSAALLGMGQDGHTASLFPGAPRLSAAMSSQQSCAAIHAPRTAVTGEYTERMSMTPAGLLRCERLFLFFTGDAKRAVYEEAKHVSDPARLPIAIFLQQSVVPLDVYWSP